MRRINAVAALVCSCLFLSAPISAFADSAHPRNLSVDWSNGMIVFKFTNRSSFKDHAAINLCRAKDPLPADWDLLDPPFHLSTAQMCAQSPLFRGLGFKINDVATGERTWSMLPPTSTEGTADYIMSVVLFDNVSTLGHHDGGKHVTMKKVTLTVPN